MDQKLRPRDVIPDGFVLERSLLKGDQAIFEVRSSACRARCPACGTWSTRVQSRYQRHAADLPLAGRRVELVVGVRRFWCDCTSCRQKIFAERFADASLAMRARRTGRLEYLVHHLGLALGGRPAAHFARRLMIPVSNDTLIRVVRRHTLAVDNAPTIVGIDDFALRRNFRYGTIVIDLEERKVLRLLPDRETATSAAWLSAHPTIRTVARDRAAAYGEAITRALPSATQVADRWHLMENASGAFLDAVRASMRRIRSIAGARKIDRKLLSAAERLQYEGWLHRRDANATVLALARDGASLKEISRQSGLSRGTVRRIVRGERGDVFRTRQSSIEAQLPWLEDRWNAGRRNGAALWRELQARGFTGSLRVVTEWATRRRRSDRQDASYLTRTPSARTLARLMTSGRDQLTKAETVTVTAVEAGLPKLAEARHLVEEFQQMLRRRDDAPLAKWVERASTSLVSSFARGIVRDEAAVHAAIVSKWSNGQTEGQVTRLKLVKRQMYGRAKIDLLEARLIGAP